MMRIMVLEKIFLNGINEVLSHHSSIIVLEEDLEVSEYFLNFMNRGINFYKDDPKVWQISGYSLILFLI